MTAPVTSSSSPTSSARRVHPFPPRRQDKTISNARNPSNPTNTIGQGSQLPFLPPPLREKFYLKKKCVSIINEKVFATKKELKICTQSLHTALRKGWKEGIDLKKYRVQIRILKSSPHKYSSVFFCIYHKIIMPGKNLINICWMLDSL